MVKAILIGKTVENLSVEEVMEKFEDMVKKFARECKRDISQFDNNLNTFEDYVQIGLLELINSYNCYDIERGASFSTLLFRNLNFRKIMLLREIRSEKRKSEKRMVYLNNEVEFEDGSTQPRMNTIKINDEKEDEYFYEETLEGYLMKNLTKDERLMVAVQLKKDSANTTGASREAFSYAIQFFADDIPVNLSKVALAEAMNIARPTLNSRIKIAMKKLRILTERYIKSTSC